MRVTLLTICDYAGSGLKLVNSVKFLSGLDIEIISRERGNGNKRFGIKAAKIIKDFGESWVKKRIASSDIIHFKGDWLHNGDWEGFNVKGKKQIYTFSGSFFRRGFNKCVAMPQHPVEAYKADYLSAFTPELCYNENIRLMEFPCNDFNYQWKQGGKFRIVHIPSHPGRKGSDVVEGAMKLLKRKDVEYISKTNISFSEMLQLKKMAAIYVDQMLLPVYGNAAVEAMAMGVPVINWDENYYPYLTPVISPLHRTAESLAEEINKHLDWKKLKELSERTFEYCRNIHGGVGEKWKTVYQKLL